MDFSWITSSEALVALLTLTLLELVLGIDNIVFISILTSKLSVNEQPKARLLGLFMAMFGRIALLLSLTWIMGLTKPWLTLFGNEISGRDSILILGGLFLLGKSTHEIHGKLEGEDEHDPQGKTAASFRAVVFQILLVDLVFSLDSVITAVGMAQHIEIMIIAVVLSVGAMMLSSGAISRFIDAHPTVKVLALSFLLLIGATLIADGLGHHFPKAYIYFAMAFSVFVELINLRVRSKSKPIKLRNPQLSHAINKSRNEES
ncbi:MAG: TerC family protein [Myxococcales bacterium]|nr:MAG: TerC family protein [Myxococcales bacterium]